MREEGMAVCRSLFVCGKEGTLGSLRVKMQRKEDGLSCKDS